MFLREANSGDILWFVRKKTGGVLAGCAEIIVVLPRVNGPNTSELGWDFEAGVWNYLVKYDKFCNLSACEIPSGIVGQALIFRGGDNFEELYSLIKKLEKSTEEIWQNTD